MVQEVLYIVFGEIFLLGLGAFMVIKPDLFWRLEHFMTVEDGEPTDFYIASRRIAGVIFFFLGVFLLLIFLAK